MAKGEKAQAGQTDKKTVLQLKPVKYKVTLLFMGRQRIKRAKGSDYNCSYELKTEDDAMVFGLTPVPNRVREQNPDDPSKKAATPLDKGGSTDKPKSELVYKVMILDPHGTRESENLQLLGNDGDNISNVKYYDDRGWMPDVKPALPFRAVVRKYIGDEQVDMDKDLEVGFEIKDPVEEFDSNDGRRRDFLTEFFTKFNRTANSASTGDDNAPRKFKGQREHPQAAAGCKATDVLKKVPYKSPPAVDQPAPSGTNPIGNGTVAFGDLTAADAYGSRGAKFKVTRVDEAASGKKVGVADLAFCPWPAGGDNYRFLVNLLDGGTDVRDTRQNGAEVLMLDDDGVTIPKPRTYVTGRFVIWRVIPFKLCVLCNATAEADINWDFVTRIYRKMFVEVIPPAGGDVGGGGGFFTMTRDAWKDLVKQLFPGLAGINDEANYTQAIFETTFVPDAIANAQMATYPDATAAARRRRLQNEMFTKIETAAKRAIAAACAQSPGNVPDPSSGSARTKQDDGNGLFMFLCRDPKVGSTLGAYIGDRIFWMQKPTGANAENRATSTCAHEFGHVRSLRHAHTGGEFASYVIGGAGTNTFIVDPASNNNPIDHDGRDAYACLMSYTRPIDAEPCGLCSLSMRFYDRVEIQKTGAFREEILRRYGPVSLATFADDGAGNITLTEVGASIALNSATHQEVEIMALGPEIEFVQRSGPPAQKGRVNMSNYPAGAGTWRATPGGRVSLAWAGSDTFIRIKVRALAPGAVTLTYRQGGDPTASVTINVS